jgi:hypothetical protein
MVGNLQQKKKERKKKAADESEAALEYMTVPREMCCLFLNHPPPCFVMVWVI